VTEGLRSTRGSRGAPWGIKATKAAVGQLFAKYSSTLSLARRVFAETNGEKIACETGPRMVDEGLRAANHTQGGRGRSAKRKA
jgi:hypothetical protein